MGLQDRIRQFASYKGLQPKSFELIVGLSNGAFSKLSDNTRKSTIDRISAAFPDLNQTWLLTGKGEMLNPYNSNVTINGNENQNNIGGQNIKISLPKSGTQKIIKPDGSIEIQSSGLGNNNSNEIDRLKEELRKKDIELARFEVLVKSKDDMICMLKEILDRH